MAYVNCNTFTLVLSEHGGIRKLSNWYQLEVDQVVQHFNTDAFTGLKQNEVRRRLQSGLNELAERGLKSPWQIIWHY